ncbi:MAG: nickel-type superoxide dismutase maturation protease [Leptolyngbyaceae cyanobacterium T60_A2020_046]|nr:nickel-type superoxide dismutase maturation protease [Leptolyngbyaceae cyanobacterium T60_A2020_046]
MPQALPSSQVQDVVLWLLRRRRRFRVRGNSMLPALKPGDEVLIDPAAYRQRSPQPGELVIAQHPHQPHLRMIKRVHWVAPDGACDLRGDNPSESSDSRTFGLVDPQLILGRVLCTFP